MRTLRTILLATDHLPASKAALLAAGQLAHASGARVSVLHVVKETPDSPSTMLIRKQLAERSQEAYLEELAGHQVDVADSSISFGSPAMMIVSKAEQLNADLIVIGAGDRPEQEPFSAGPVAEIVMQHARQPVLAVRPGSPAVEFRKTLCPVDFSTVSRRGLRNAIRLTQIFHGELVVLSVIPELSWLGAVSETGVFLGAQEQHAAQWADEFGRFLDGTDFSGVQWSRDIRPGTPYRQIVLAAREHQADLLVMGATGRTGLIRLLMGSVTRRVLQDLPCSILTVHDEDLLVEEPSDEDLRIARLLYAEGDALVSAKDYQAALAKLDQVLAHNPFHVLALEARAEVCQQLGQTVPAQRSRRRAEILRQETLK